MTGPRVYQTPARSKYRGVTPKRAKWQARICAGRGQCYLGTFDTEEQAARAFDASAKFIFARRAILNFPEQQA